MVWMCCSVVPILFGWFLMVPSLHVIVFIQKTFLWLVYLLTYSCRVVQVLNQLISVHIPGIDLRQPLSSIFCNWASYLYVKLADTTCSACTYLYMSSVCCCTLATTRSTAFNVLWFANMHALTNGHTTIHTAAHVGKRPSVIGNLTVPSYW